MIRTRFQNALQPVNTEVVTLDEFLRLYKEQPENLAETRIVAPAVGKPGFGSIEVTYVTPRLRPNSARAGKGAVIYHFPRVNPNRVTALHNLSDLSFV
jgi:hypothetical protein